MKIRQSVGQIYNARVFFDENNQGNHAQCILLCKRPDINTVAAYTVDASGTSCFSWRENQIVHVQCYQGAYPVDFCGHGLLATVHAWSQRFALPRSQLELLSFQTARQNYGVRVTGGGVWLRVPRLRCRISTLPSDIEDYFSVRPREMAAAGGHSDYQIFRFDSGTDIATVEVSFERLRKDTRATIITQSTAVPESSRSEIISRDWSFTLRYFAPRFGVEEDIATGSANAVLADFWAQRQLAPPFRARQCSPAGGVIESDIEADGSAVLISGNVSITPAEEKGERKKAKE